MKEILFRGKNVEGYEWVYGDCVTIFDSKRVRGIETTKGIYEIYPDTLGQFTGLTDKNGKKIFEGDIVKYENKIYEIKYLEKYARFAPSNEHSVFMVCAFNRLEVVGNIHDEPELLYGGIPSENYIDKICLSCSKKCQEYLARGVDLYKRDIKNLRADFETLNEIKEELYRENAELKRLLKLAIEDFDLAMNIGKCGVCGNSCCEATTICKWRYKKEAEKLLKGE
jgi:uncharacterized phage protein (TIGR01671 family)